MKKITVLAYVLIAALSNSAFAKSDLCKQSVEKATLAVETVTAKGSYQNEDCEVDCHLAVTIKIVSTDELVQKEVQPADLVGKYLVKTSTLEKYPHTAEYHVIYRSYDIGMCTILRVERIDGIYSLPHDSLEKL
jgi:hypothetical protein